MRSVYFDDAKAGVACATRRGGKRGDNFPNAIGRERLRLWIILGKRNRTRRHDIFPAAFALRDSAVAFPWPARARFATGMRQLHSCDAALVVNETNDTPQRLDMSVAPDTKILRADAALRQDRSRFGHHQSRAADRATAEMDEMPVVRQTV